MDKFNLKKYLKEGRLLQENTNENVIGKVKDFFKFRSVSQLSKAITQILDRLENLPEVIDAKKEGGKQEAARERREFYCDNGTIKLRPSDDADVPLSDKQIKQSKKNN